MFFNEYLAMATFALAMAFTPGPNNIMLAASGVNFGFMRSVPHLAGVIVGFALLVVACGVGLGLIFNAAPALQLALKIAGAVYMLWLAFKVATAHRSDSEGGFARAAPDVLAGVALSMDQSQGADRGVSAPSRSMSGPAMSGRILR